MSVPAELLSAGGDNVRTAILMGRTGRNREESERLLAESGGRVAQALAKAEQLHG